ncbi:MAG TPA: cytosine deaminase [Stellaceae bacterium]|nr:cytosine deaminase [Stellaceae bacterium]
MGFLDTLAWPEAGRYWIRRARVPAGLLAATVEGASADRDGALLVDILVDGERIGRIEPAAADAAQADGGIDLAGRQAWPALIDMHAHIDKGHVIPRIANPDGSFAGARQATTDDREKHWRSDDVRRRMEFALRCAYAHGVACIRTHIDSHEGSAETSWGVFRELRAAWQGRVALQAVALVPIDAFRGPYGARLADLVAASGGVLGGVTRATGGVHSGMLADIDALLDTLLRLAAERGLDVDLHVDESGDPEAAALPRVAAAVLRNRFRGRVVCGHCCSLALQPDDAARRTLALCAEAGVAVVTLPTVNLYLQDRERGRTPRWRGVTLIKEMRDAGIPVAVGGDNCRDPFYAYGDHDMVDTLRQAIKIAHLDHPFGDVPAMAGPVPAAIIGAAPLGSLAPGGPARLVLFAARTLNELVCRPQSDRIVIDRGRRVMGGPPDYAELDDA